MSLGYWASSHVAAGGAAFSFTGSGVTTASGTVRTASGVNFGPAAANRVLIVAIGTRVALGSQISSVTVGGVAATIDVRTSNWPVAVIARASVPTGTSGDVVFTYVGGEIGQPMVAVYSAIGAVTVDSTGANGASGTAGLTVALTNSAGSAFVAVAAVSVDGPTFTWSGESVVVDATLSGASQSNASFVSSDNASVNASITSTVSQATWHGVAAATYTIT